MIHLAIAALAIVSAGLPAPAVPLTCRTPGDTVASGRGTRLYRVGDALYGCWADAGRARLLDQIDAAAPAEVALPRSRAASRHTGWAAPSGSPTLRQGAPPRSTRSPSPSA